MPKRKTKKHSWLAKAWRRYEYKHTTSAIIAILCFVLALDTALVQASLAYIEHLGLLGIFIAGMMFTSFFTTAPAIALLVLLSNDYDPLTLGLIGGLGSLVGDWIILKVFEERIAYELKPLIKKFGLGSFFKKLKRKKERERTLLLGMAVIISPLPDEVGIGLMGLSKLSLPVLLMLIYILNTLGIILVAVTTQL